MPNSGDDDYKSTENEWIWLHRVKLIEYEIKLCSNFFHNMKKLTEIEYRWCGCKTRDGASMYWWIRHFFLSNLMIRWFHVCQFFTEIRAQKFTLRLVIMAGQKSETSTRRKKCLQKDFLKQVTGWLWIKTFFFSIISQSTTSKHIFSYLVIYEHILSVDTYIVHTLGSTLFSRHQNSLTISFHFIRLS